MKLRTRLRSSSALWAAPFGLALALFYYFMVTADALSSGGYGYAPTLVAYPLSSMYPFAYALAAALGAWESSRLARGGIWELGPTRSRFRVAGETLGPVVGLAWLMLVLPVAIAFVQLGGGLPTLESLRPLLMALSVCVAHAVLGFAVGLWVRAEIAAPVLAVGVYLAVAFPVASETFWWRHVVGQYPHTLSFGEVATWTSMAAQALPTCGVALGIASLWLSSWKFGQRLVLSVLLVAVSTLTAWSLTRTWGPVPPVDSGEVAMTCVGQNPKVCMPDATAQRIATVRDDVRMVLGRLRDAGIDASPTVVTDTLQNGRYPKTSTDHTWRLSLTSGERKGIVRYQVVRASVNFPCARPELSDTRMAVAWAASKAGEEEPLENLLAEDPFYGTQDQKKLRETLAEVGSMPAAEQLDWYESTLDRACAGAEGAP